MIDKSTSCLRMPASRNAFDTASKTSSSSTASDSTTSGVAAIPRMGGIGSAAAADGFSLLTSTPRHRPGERFR